MKLILYKKIKTCKISIVVIIKIIIINLFKYLNFVINTKNLSFQ